MKSEESKYFSSRNGWSWFLRTLPGPTSSDRLPKTFKNRWDFFYLFQHTVLYSIKPLHAKAVVLRLNCKTSIFSSILCVKFTLRVLRIWASQHNKEHHEKGEVILNKAMGQSLNFYFTRILSEAELRGVKRPFLRLPNFIASAPKIDWLLKLTEKNKSAINVLF